MILKPIDNLAEFCRSAEPQLGVFASQKWLSVYGNRLSLIGIYKDEHQLIGGFCFLKIKKFGCDFIKLPPYTPHCCLFFHLESKNSSARASFLKELMSHVSAYLLAQKSALTILAFPAQVIDLQPFIWQKFKVIPNYTYRIALQRSMEEIQAQFDSKNRNAINKALKEHVEVSLNSLSGAELFQYFKKNLYSAGANVYEMELEQVFTSFANPENAFSFAAHKNGQLVGAVFCVYDQKVCYYLMGAVNKSAGVGGINNLLLLKSIEQAKRVSCELFDFEGSMLPGVERFFRSFGGELVPYYTVNKATLPLELLLKFKKREIF